MDFYKFVKTYLEEAYKLCCEESQGNNNTIICIVLPPFITINVIYNDKKVIYFTAPKKEIYPTFSGQELQQLTPYNKTIGGGLAKATVHM